MLDTRLIESHLAALVSQPIEPIEKGLPARPGLTLANIANQGWTLDGGELPFPVLALRWEAMLGNIRRMQSFCDSQQVHLAPHGKTTMAPQIFLEQLRAGAWGITVATVRQARICAALGVPRIVLANQPTAPNEFRALAELMATDQSPEMMVFVDNTAVIHGLADEMRSRQTGRPLSVMIEVGFDQGRGGIRSLDEIDSLMLACAGSAPELQLSGIAGYEGILPEDKVGPFLHHLSSVAQRLRSLDDKARVISAGGSRFFDRVVENLGRDALPDFQLVLRSGAYVTHDHGLYHRGTPFGPGRPLGGEPFAPALELWSTVSSRPEPELAILAFGRRDTSDDSGPPIALGRWDGHQLHVVEAQVTGLNDQHAYVRIPNHAALQPGDIFVCGVSHPCTTFDRWRFALTVDETRRVTGAVRTFF